MLDRTERLSVSTVRMAFDTNKLAGGHTAYPHDHRRGHGGGGGGHHHRGDRGDRGDRGERRSGGFSN